MNFREINRRIRIESACLNPILLGICAGAAVLLGALFTTNPALRPAGIFLPRTALPSFFHILFQLVAYAVFGAAFAAFLRTPYCDRKQFRLPKLCGNFLFVCTLVLCYVWIPVVCKAKSFFLGTLLCGVILIALLALVLITYRISVLSTLGLIFFSVWMLYILYLTITLLFFA